jgi:hypothetical protein
MYVYISSTTVTATTVTATIDTIATDDDDNMEVEFESGDSTDYSENGK